MSLQSMTRCAGVFPFMFLTLLACLVFSQTFARAATVSLSWDANADADYYIVYWKTTPDGDPVADSGNIGKVTTFDVDGLTGGGSYYFAVKAFNACGNSSDFSDWVPGTAPLDPDNESPPIVDEEPPVEPGNEIPPVADEETPGGDTPDSDVSGIYDGETEVEDPAFPIASGSPGERSPDGFIPATESSFLQADHEYPNIEVLDNTFQHLLWLKSGWSSYNELNAEARIAMGDIDGDGKDEVIIGFAPVEIDSAIPGGFFQVLDDDYSHLGWGRVEWSDYNETNGETWPASGDVDGDGQDEIVIGLGPGGRGYIEIFNYQSRTIAHHSWITVQWPDYNDMNGEARPACGDIDGDGTDEIIAGLSSDARNTTIPGGRFEIFRWISDTWTHVLWGAVDWLEYEEINGETWPSPGDLDGDGALELAVGLGYGGDGQIAIFEFENNQAQLSQWTQIEWPEYNEFLGETRPACGDIDNDGKDEIVLGWNTQTPDSGNENFLKVLSYSSANKRWNDLVASKSIGSDEDSVPTRGALGANRTILVGLGDVLFKGANQELPDSNLPAPKVSGAEAGGSGCFVQSALVF